MGSKGKRFNNEKKKLNYTKIFAIIIFLIVLAMVVLGIKKILTTKVSSTGRIATINYFPVYTNGKWGVINSNGDIVIEPKYKEMIIIPNSSKPYFLCTYNVNYETGKYNTKVVNEKDEIVINGYDNVNFMDNYDKEGNITYLDNVLKVEKNGKYGLITLSGTEILDCEYEEITILKGVENSLLIKKDGLFGLCDYNGKIIIKTEYADIKNIGDNYKNGYITISTDNLYGIIDFNSDIIFNNKYTEIKPIYSSNKYVVKTDGKYKIINKSENAVLNQEFEDIKEINNNEIIYKQNNKYGIINTNGESILDPEYDDLTFIDSNRYIVKQNNKYGVININKEMQLESKYENIQYISSASIIIGKTTNNQYDLYDKTNMELKLTVNSLQIKDSYIIVKIKDETKYYNFKFEEKSAKDILIGNTIFSDRKNGKYGFVDENSNIIVDYKYDEVTQYNTYGFAGIKLNGLWGVVDIEGKEIIQPKYNLENNKEINFIGKWHISVDGTYYTDM